MSVEVSVKQGRIHVNSVWVVVESPSVVVLEADLRAKHAVLGGFSGDEVWLDAEEGKTLHAEGGEDMTAVRVRTFKEQEIDATVSRYTLRIYIIDRAADVDRAALWSDS